MSTTSPSSTADYYGIHTGPWINWSDGRILGGTITLTRRDGGFLISLIALFITWTGTAFWRLSCFFIHHYCSSEAPRDGVHHQRQAVLRNSANGISGLWALAQMAWVWRDKTPHAHRRMVPLLLFTITCLGCFAVAGIFSSKIATSTASQVLISGPSCGQLYTDGNTNETLLDTVYQPFVHEKVVEWANFAQTCYKNSSNPAECQRYVQLKLPYSTKRNASCPFGGDICQTEFGNLEIDTGYIDSNEHLGHNDPPELRFKFRHILRCAPLATQGYKQPYTYASEGTQSRYVRYYYGELRSPYNYTYEYPISSFQEWLDQNFTGPFQDYTLSIQSALYRNQSLDAFSTFDPIPELRYYDGDIKIFFLSSNFVAFAKETDDPWYSAHSELLEVGTIQATGTISTYAGDEPASPLACVSQYQFCNPNLPSDKQCTALGPMGDAFGGITNLRLSRTQEAMIEWYLPVLDSDIAQVIMNLGITGLTARYGLTYGVQGPLPNGQWQIDVEYWFTVWLAYMQGSMVLYATGPSNPEMMAWVDTPKNEVERSICRNQKIVTTAYTSFNTFGLCLTFIVGCIIIVFSYTIEPLASWIQKRRRFDNYSRLEWCANETLQLQRMAHEGLGVGTWHHGAEAIPYTDNGERLATLNLANPEHPRLEAPPTHFDNLLAGESNENPGASPGITKEYDLAASTKLDPGRGVNEVRDTSSNEHSEQQIPPERPPSAEELEDIGRHVGVSNADYSG
ncbi:cytochrome p450 protein [Diplodia corticola]|uniref:Cytochrome p450 protein n=1 Tax=Diplodia corticola TaxID=236234 RepID=A0A1J9RP17_9PEZI|nr:cytochrome p450 protein [Diplodia corticola]OJD29668.1 cytochrome p450 protein [Diplodia corticola]